MVQRSPAYEVRSQLRPFHLTPTVSSGAIYAANDVVGSLLKLGGLGAPPGIRLQTIVIADKDAQNVDYKMIFFDAAPTSIADNAQITTIADIDTFKICYEKVIDAATYRSSFTNSSIHRVNGLDVPLVADPTGGVDLYAFLITTGTPTFTSVSAVGIYLLYSGGA